MVSDLPQLMRLEAVCDGSHKHKPWGVKEQGSSWSFNTSEEAEYPGKLCLTAAQAVAEYAESKGVQVVKHLSRDPSAVQPAAATATLRAESGKQPRGKVP